MGTEAKRSIHIVITAAKVHLYGSHSRLMKVRERGQRMFPGAKWEVTSNTVRKGDPFSRVPMARGEQWGCQWGVGCFACEAAHA